MDTNVKIEQITLQDGRRAERHSYINEQGGKVVEIYVEQKSPYILEKRIVREPQRETVEMIQDGKVVTQEVVTNSQQIDSDFVKEEVAKLIADGVVAAMKGLGKIPENTEPTKKVSARSIIEQKIENKTDYKKWINAGLIVLAVSQVTFFLYYVFAM